MHRINLDGTIQLGDSSFHPDVHAISDRYLTHHFGEAGTESYHNIESMGELLHYLQPDHQLSTESGLKEQGKPVKRAVLSHVMTHAITDRLVDYIHREKDTEKASRILRVYASGIRSHDGSPLLSTQQQHKVVGVFERITKINPEHLWKIRLSGSVANQDSIQRIFARHIRDAAVRTRLHDHLDELEKSGDPKKMETGRILRGHMIASSPHAEEMKRMWTGLANNPDYADMNSEREHERRMKLGTDTKGKDMFDKKLIMNSEPLEQLAHGLAVLRSGEHITSRIPTHQKLDVAAHAYHLMDTHPTMKRHLEVFNTEYPNEDPDTSMHGPYYWRRRLATAVGESMRSIGHPGFQYDRSVDVNGQKAIEEHIARKQLSNRI